MHKTVPCKGVQNAFGDSLKDNGIINLVYFIRLAKNAVGTANISMIQTGAEFYTPY